MLQQYCNHRSCSRCCQIIQIYSGITSGRVLDGELLYTKIAEVNLFALVSLFAFAYRRFHEDFAPIYGRYCQNVAPECNTSVFNVLQMYISMRKFSCKTLQRTIAHVDALNSAYIAN